MSAVDDDDDAKSGARPPPRVDGESLVRVVCDDDVCFDTTVPLSSFSPGDIVCDGDECVLMADTVADGLVDAAIPIRQTVPFQDVAQRIVVSPFFEAVSVLSTLVLLVTFSIEYRTLEPATRELIEAADLLFSTFFVIEFIARWWAVGFRPKFLQQPLTFFDALNVLPIIVSPGLPFLPGLGLGWWPGLGPTVAGTPFAPLAPLRLLRSFRILRLRRLLQPEELTKLVRTVTNNPSAEVSEGTRAALRLAFSAVSIVVISAGTIWQCERAVNSQLVNYMDAIYFSLTTLTTVGLGDISPITANGRAVVTVEMIAAVTVIPLEIAALSKALLQENLLPAATGPNPEFCDTFCEADDAPRARRRLACGRCGLEDHEGDAAYCRRCGAVLADGAVRGSS